VLLEGWEQFHEPVDRIVSIGAFEHFHASRYDDFFTFAHDALPGDGVMLLHTITISDAQAGPVKQLPVTLTLLRFIKFIMTEIFPGGQLPGIATVTKHAKKARFCVGQVQSLQPHYAKTLDMWAAALHAHKDDAIASQSDEIYQRYMKYLTGWPNSFATATPTSVSSPSRNADRVAAQRRPIRRVRRDPQVHPPARSTDPTATTIVAASRLGSICGAR
jgi:cyclopropane-fatty-acyl-phospholipid synthase